MEYLASEIIERAKNLADIGNTDYISHEEAIQYLNDSYGYVYQLSINRGDNFFVKTMSVGNGFTALPKDFYQLKSVKNPYSGHLYTRRVENASISEEGYEIVNNKINITGCRNACEMAYYPNPKLMTFPNKPKEYFMPIVSGKYSLWENNYVYVDSDNGGFGYYNVSTGETVSIEHDKYDYDNLEALYASNNYFVAVGKDKVDYISYEGDDIKSVEIGETCMLFRKQNGDIEVLDSNNIIYRGQNTLVSNTQYIQGSSEALYYISDGILYRQRLGEAPQEISKATSFYVTRKFGKDYVVFENDALFAEFDDDIWVLDVDYSTIIGFNSDYIVVSDGVKPIGYSNEPDILLNYPDNVYYTLLAYQLAVYFVIKQGGNPGLLVDQLDTAKFNFENNAQDSFTSVRIKNVYN